MLIRRVNTAVLVHVLTKLDVDGSTELALATRSVYVS
jgi:hypothetical protein